jgi:NADP-dependent 3-hydroxy acid dehydrogenase YdfG
VAVSVDLSGRRILVTGASSGIGEVTCRALVGCGASVAMLARRNDRLTALSAELGERAIGIQCDVTDLDMLDACVARAVGALGGLDAVVTVAGRALRVLTVEIGDGSRFTGSGSFAVQQTRLRRNGAASFACNG